MWSQFFLPILSFVRRHPVSYVIVHPKSKASPQFLSSHPYPHSCLKFGFKKVSMAYFESQHVSEIAICEVENHISFHLLLRISRFSAEIPTCRLVKFWVF